MDTKDASIFLFLKRILNSGKRKSLAIRNATMNNNYNWLRWVGIVLQYGNVN